MEDAKRTHEGTRIRIVHEDEIDYWCRKFRVNRAQLEQAINAVGPEVEHVQEYLAKPQA